MILELMIWAHLRPLLASMGEPGYTESGKSEKEGWEATVAGPADGRGGKIQIKTNKNSVIFLLNNTYK
jgi:hypothetical protein